MIHRLKCSSLPANAIDPEISSVTSGSDSDVDSTSSILGAEVSGLLSATKPVKPIGTNVSHHADIFPPEIGSVISASDSDVDSKFSVLNAEVSGSSSAIESVELVSLDSRQVADEFLSLIGHEALLGPLLMSVFERLEQSDDINLRSYLLSLLGKYWDELLLHVQQKPVTNSQRLAAEMLYAETFYIVDKMYAEYGFHDRSTSKTLEQAMLRIPGEMQEQRSQRVSKIVANAAKLATRSEPLERKSSIVSTDGLLDQDYSTQADLWKHSRLTTMYPNAKVVFAVVKDFLVSGVAFGHLRLALRDTLHQKPMDIVRQEVFSGIPSSDEISYDVTFFVYWDIRQYLENELTPRQTLASVLTVSGGSRDAFATPCGSYIQWLWSEASVDLLDALDETMKHGKHG